MFVLGRLDDRLGNVMKHLVIVLVSLVAAAVLFVGCGAQVTVQDIIDRPSPEPITPAPSDTTSAALLSGFGISQGGDHYRIVQSLGGPMAKPVQESEGGTYVIKRESSVPLSGGGL